MRGIRIRHVQQEDIQNFIKSSKSYENNTHNCKKRHGETQTRRKEICLS